jgi:DNA (cytosine-5)-methyltransferase 1
VNGPNYYNEHDPKAASWLRELIAQKLIPDGTVDTRSIVEVQPADLDGFTQCHFFAGIGGWPLALHLAGYPTTRPVWTGSCPCQPFSDAGLKLGELDERHLWPAFYRLISQCRPPVVFGEQVASKAALQWLDGVFADLESSDYACGAADLCAASVGAPHIRQRLFWVANAGPQSARRRLCRSGEGIEATDERASNQPGGSGSAGGLVLANGAGRHAGEQTAEAVGHGSAALATGSARGVADAVGEQEFAADSRGLHSEPSGSGIAGGLEHADSDGREQRRSQPDGRSLASGCGLRGLGDADDARLEGHRRFIELNDPEGRESAERYDPTASIWGGFDLIPCADGKARRIESGTFPLAHGLPKGMVRGGDPSIPINPQATAEARVMRLKGYGNAIVPELAAEFIKAFLET